jgi:UDP:flavonoid glycosyltransferase YjiC (YdhE family)
MAPRVYDILLLADWRCDLAAAWYLGNLIEAQLAAGYRTALIQVDGPASVPRRPFSAPIRGLIERRVVDWLDPALPVVATLALAVDALAFVQPVDRPPRIACAQSLLLCPRPVTDAEGRPLADLEQIQGQVDELFDQPCRWLPAHALIRAGLAPLADLAPLAASDWPPVLEAARWRQPKAPGDRLRTLGTLAVEPAPELADLARLLPEDPRFTLRLYGEPAALRAGRQPWPGAWRIDDPARRPLAEHLAALDGYVERAADPLAMGALFAAAAGLPVLAPPRLRPYLHDLALYAEPKHARARIAALAEDGAALATQRAGALALVQERHGWAAHQRRLRELIGAPAPDPGIALRRPRGAARRVLFVSTNGVGMGHLTRQLAIARRLPGGIEPVFLTMSQAFALVREFGFMVEYTPYHAYYGGDTKHWNVHLARLLDEMLAFYDPSVVVFDGNYPFQGVVAAAKQHRSRRFVWCRRGLWRPNQDPEALRRSAAFDLILEPEELAARFDRGPTRAARAETRPIAPIRLLDEDELLPRAEAAAALGLDPDRPAALLQLGSRNNFDMAPLLDRLLPALRRVDGLQLVAAEWLISDQDSGWQDPVRTIRRYPLARELRAFDFVVATPGYNAFHELAAYGVPAIFVPNENPRMDDHLARAAFAERQGFGLALARAELHKVDATVAAIAEPDRRALMRKAAARWSRPNGAAEAATALAELAFALRTLEQAWLHGLHRRNGATARQ